jgi:hypothetical protein
MCSPACTQTSPTKTSTSSEPAWAKWTMMELFKLSIYLSIINLRFLFYLLPLALSRLTLAHQTHRHSGASAARLLYCPLPAPSASTSF